MGQHVHTHTQTIYVLYINKNKCIEQRHKLELKILHVALRHDYRNESGRMTHPVSEVKRRMERERIKKNLVDES